MIFNFINYLGIIFNNFIFSYLNKFIDFKKYFIIHKRVTISEKKIKKKNYLVLIEFYKKNIYFSNYLKIQKLISINCK